MGWAPDYVTDEELGNYLSSASSVTTAPFRAVAIAAASRVIDQASNRQFGKVAELEARTYTARWDRRRCAYVVPVDDLEDTTGMTVTVAGATITDYTLKRDRTGHPYTTLISTASLSTDEDAVEITALWGWNAVPDTIVQATLIQAHRFYMRQHAAFGVAGSPELGNELRLLERIDADVAVMLRPYTRHWGAA